VADVLFSPVQQRVFGLLFGQPERSFGSAELIRLVGSGTGATHRILTRLADVGLVTVTRIGNQKHYQANPESPIFGELHGLMTKTVGLLQPLRNALEPFAGDLQAAFVYGSVAKGNDRARSDVDLLVISDHLDHGELFGALLPVQEKLGREVSATVFGTAEWREKRADEQGFVSRVARSPRLFVIGTPDDAP
jgi:predicted nucleotidyltransferase